jgi:uncharacterized protein YndB with AHSA1/START domain
MSPAVCTSVDIHASPQDVWDVVMDPRLLDRWVTTHVGVADVPERLSSGSSFEQTLKLAGKSFTVRWTVAHACWPCRADWLGEGPYGSHARVTYELERLDDGGTRFWYENDFELPAGVLGSAAGRLVGHSRAQREAARSLRRLKLLLEKEPLIRQSAEAPCPPVARERP